MRMTLWFDTLRRQFGSLTGTKSRRHGSGRTRRLTPAFAESLEDRCLLAAGDLDLSFGVGGKVTTAFQGDAQGNSVAVQSDGRLVVAGYTHNGSNYDFALVRYTTDGTLDTSFDGDGKLTTGFTKNDYANSVAIQADGKIVVAGYVNSNGDFYDFALARFNSNGSPDTSFDGDGKLRTDIGKPTDFERGDDTATSMALQADGKIVVAGYTHDYSFNRVEFALVRYTTDGTLDTSFDGDGKLTTPFYGSDYATSVVVQANGQIVVAGYTAFFADFALVRYNRNGSLDTSFDGDGKLSTNFGGNDYAHGLAVQSDGKIIVAGYTNNGGGDYDFALVRYNSSGSLSTSFNGDGKLTTEFFGYDDHANSVVLQSDDKIVVAGYSFNGSQYVFALARYTNTAIDEPPTFTTENTASVQENTTSIQTVAATDPENDTLNYSINGGADQTLFTIDSITGALSFKSPPDFEYPIDANYDNAYEVQVAVSDGTHLVTQNVIVSVTNVNEAPVITSNGGGATAAINAAENQTAVTTVTATDDDLPAQTVRFSITGGADEARFSITSGGVLTFVAAPNFEIPTDVGDDNVYDVQVTATDNGTGNLTDVQIIAVTVTDNAPVNEAPVITGPPFANSSQRPVISWTPVTGATEYEIWVTKNPSTNQYHGATVTQTSYTPPVDFGIGKFNLWVRAKNSETIGPWTPRYTFVINTAAVLHGITRFQPTLRPTINWDVLPGAVKYDVWINDVSRGIIQYIRNTNVTGTTFTPSADLPLGIYRAWVRGIAADGTAAAWSGMTEFVTMQAPTITQGQNPTFNRTPTFAWNDLPGAAKYEVLIRNRNTGATTVDERNITGLSFTPATPLADGPYRWWVIGVSAQGVRSFWTAPMDIYIGGRTDLLSPAGSSNEATPTFAWRPVDGAVRYDLWVNQVGGQAQIIRQQNLTGTNYTPITSLPTGSYRAWIRAVSSTGEVSPWSLEVAFTITAIAPLGDSESSDGIPDVLLAVLPKELQVKNLGSNTTRSSCRIIDTREIQPEERIPKIDGRDWASIPTYTDVRSEQFDDDLLLAAIHEFLEGTCL